MNLFVNYSVGSVESVGCVGFVEFKGVECICLLRTEFCWVCLVC